MGNIGIIFTVAFLLLVICRIAYVNMICEEWNKSLSNYIRTRLNDNKFNAGYFRRYYLEPLKYYYRLDVWSVKAIINDPFLLDDIYRQRYREMVKKNK